jgi:AraC-like DNA-binding protein
MGVLIQKNSVYKTLLPILASNSQLFEFFFKPKKNIKSEEYIHLKFPKNSPVKALLNIMIMEYAYKTEDTQDILKPLVVALLMNVAREYKLQNPVRENISLSKKMVQYINEKLSNASLKGLSKQFKYHPNYICSLLHKETGKTFSQLLLELRMQRAETLLTQTFLPIEEIALSLGYSDSSNFYKVFKSFYKCSPREFVRKQRNK